MPKLLKPAHQALAGVSLPIIAAHHGDGIARRTVLALHHCKSCDSQVVMNKLRVPACVVCSAVTNLADEAPENDLVFTPENMRELPKVGHCDNCDTTLRAESALAKALVGKRGHCPTCATIVTFAAFDDEEFEDDASDEDPEADEEYSEAFGDEPEDAPEDDSSSDGGVYGDGDEVSDVPEDADTNLFGGEDANADEEELDEDGNPILATASARRNAKRGKKRLATKAGVKKRRAQAELDDEEVVEGEEIEEDVAEDERKPSPDADPNAPPQNNSPNPAQPASADPNAQPQDNQQARQIGASVLAQFLRKPRDAHIDIVLAGTDENPKYFLFIDEKPAAVAHITRAKQSVRAFFGTDKFAQAFVAAVEDGITQDAITDFGFEPVNTQIPVDEATEMKVEQAVDDATKELNNKIAEAASLFERCVGIASVGAVKNVINDVDNPMRTALVSQLTKLRVRNAANVVDSILAEHGESYLREIVAKAKELTRKPSQALDELASVVAQASFSFPVEAGIEEAEEKAVVPFMATASHEQETVATPSGGRDDDTMELLRGIRFAHVR